MDRRSFLKGLGHLAAADAALTLLPSQLLAQEFLMSRAGRAGLNILQGLTTETSTQLTIDLPKQSQVELTLTDRHTGKVFQPTAIKTATNAKSPIRVDKVLFTQLELGHQYQLIVKDKATNKNLDERFLSTVDLSRSDACIAVMSCMNDSKSVQRSMWSSALAANADYLFFIGDAVYGDTFLSHGPDKLWSRCVETRTKLSFYQWKTLKPVLAVWDDHDFGKNNEDGNYAHKAGTLAVFKSFFAQETVAPMFFQGPGNSSYFKAFNQNFLFLDCRYFRNLPNNGIRGFLGREQMGWASSMMQNANGPVWIMEGSPFFGRAEKSSTSYEATAPEELELFLKQVSTWNSPAVFMAGDLHYTETSGFDKRALGYKSFEFISSSMHSSTKSRYYSNPNKYLQRSLKENFLLFKPSGSAGDPAWNVSCVGANSNLLFNGLYNVG